MSACLHIYFSHRFYYEWVTTRPGIDGGPLGFLSWSIPVLVGSLAYDVMMRRRPSRAFSTLLVAGVMVLGLGYGLSCVPWFRHEAGLAALPFCPPIEPINLWTMSQRSGSVSYMTFSAGFSLALYAIFVGLCDLARLRISLFDLFGRNALLVYLLQDLAGDWLSAYMPHDAPGWFMLCGFAAYLGMMTFLVGYLERSGVRLRL
jgi:predicted acyltransferase